MRRCRQSCRLRGRREGPFGQKALGVSFAEAMSAQIESVSSLLQPLTWPIPRMLAEDVLERCDNFLGELHSVFIFRQRHCEVVFVLLLLA
jgi:hypothetical protein